MGNSPRDRTPFGTGPCASLPIHTRRHLSPCMTPGWPCARPPSISTSTQGKGSTAVSGWVFIQKAEWVGVPKAEALALGLGLGADKALSWPPLRGPERPRPSAEPRAHKCSVHPGCGWGKATSPHSACLGLTVPPAPHLALQVTQTGLGEAGQRGSRDLGLRARALLFRGVAKHSSTAPRRVWFTEEGPGLLGLTGSEAVSYHGHSLGR